MAPSGRVCDGDERLIIPSWSKCDGDDVEQVPSGLMTREHGILGKIAGMTGKCSEFQVNFVRHVSHEVSILDVALNLLIK